MIFIETSFFTEDVKQLLSDVEYGKLQQHLAAQIRMLTICKKGVQDALTAKQKAVLRKINEGWKN